MAHMYILECGDGTLYVGSTRDLEFRLAEHQSGVNCKYTSKRQPVRLLYAEEFHRIDDAFAREKQVQNWSRAKRLALIAGDMERLKELSRSRIKD